MRVTNALLAFNTLNGISGAFESLSKIREDLLSGKRLRIPSDDPNDFTAAVQLRRVLENQDQFLKNIKDSGSSLDVAEAAIISANDVMHRARILAVRAADETRGRDAVLTVVDELNRLIESMAEVANTQFGDTFVFAGQKTNVKPFVPSGDPIQSVAYVGDGNFNTREIADNESVPVTLPGDQVFMGGSDPMKNVFTALINLRNMLRDVARVSLTSISNTNQDITAAEAAGSTLAALTAANEFATPPNDGGGPLFGEFKINEVAIDWNTGQTINTIVANINAANAGVTASFQDDVDGVVGNDKILLAATNGKLPRLEDVRGNFVQFSHLQEPLEQIDIAMRHLVDQEARIGSIMKRLEIAEKQSEDSKSNLTSRLSKLEDADFPKRVVDLTLQETTLRAALDVGSRTVQPSLFDFLR